MTVREANKTLKTIDSRLAIRRTVDGEYRVSLNNREASAYYTDSLSDALETGKAMAYVVNGPQSTRTDNGGA